MCLNNRKYPLVRDRETGKKKVLFTLPFEVINRDSIDEEMQFTKDCQLACKGLSSSQTMNKLMTGYEFIDVISVPCGICSECLQDHARQWAIRIMQEAQLHEHNWFITFTYDDEHLPYNQMLVKDEISKFNKKLKTYLKRNGQKSDFRFYAVGEYGSHTARPHYHGIYFGLDIPDLKFAAKSSRGDLYLESKFLESVWQKGQIKIGEVTMQSAAYVARYCDKKKQLTPLERKEIRSKGIVPEFSVMSRRPGIGSGYLGEVKHKIENGIYKLSLNGKVYSFPMYYTKKLEEIVPEEVMKEYKLSKQRNSAIKIFDDIAMAEHAGHSLHEFYEIKKSELKEKEKAKKEIF